HARRFHAADDVAGGVVARVDAPQADRSIRRLRIEKTGHVEIAAPTAGAAQFRGGVPLGVVQLDAIDAVTAVGAPQTPGAVVIEILLAPAFRTAAGHLAE